MLNRVPDNSVIVKGQGDKGEHIEAFHDGGNTYAMIYLPVGKTVTINISIFSKKITAWWFNPKDGIVKKIITTVVTDYMQFTPPTVGIENDWVLVIDDASGKYPAPGKAL